VRSGTLKSCVLVCAVWASAAASLRLDAIGPNLAGILDDPVWDFSAYPQLNCLDSGWLAGGEFLTDDRYCLFGRPPGPLSVGAVVPMTLKARGDIRLAVPLSVRTRKLTLGATMWVPTWLTPNADTLYRWYTDHYWARTFDWSGYLGCHWTRPMFSADAGVALAFQEITNWTVADSVVTVRSRERRQGLKPAVRLTLGRGRLAFRAIASYQHWFVNQVDYYPYVSPSLIESAELTVGLVWRPVGQATLSAAVRAGLHSSLGPFSPWLLEQAVVIPVGVEFTPLGSVMTWRLGVDLQYDSDFFRRPAFRRHFHAGFAVNPLRNLSIEFLPGLDDAAVLTDWEVAFTVKF
jgi:hypothetical protein